MGRSRRKPIPRVVKRVTQNKPVVMHNTDADYAASERPPQVMKDGKWIKQPKEL